MIWSTQRVASSNSSRATGWSRIAGYLPLSSRPGTGTSSRHSRGRRGQVGLTRRAPVNGGTGRSSNGTTSRWLAAARREQPAAAGGWRCCTRSRSWSAGVVLGQHLARSGSAGRTPRDHPGRVEHVHCRRVVGRRDPHRGVLAGRGAPPISSGSFSPRRCISAGHRHHLVQRRRDQADSPIASAPSATAVSRILAAGTITPRSITS